MMTKREEAARAVRDNLPSRAFLTDLESLKVFDAVIACIRKPDEKMIEAGNDAIIIERSGSNEVLQAMLDAMT